VAPSDAPPYNGRRMVIRILFILYCFEAGIFFVIVPWTKFWAQNPLLQSFDLARLLAGNFYFRGLVMGFGLVHFIVGIREIGAMLVERSTRGASPGDTPEPR
jgi:hypothetical protein